MSLIRFTALEAGVEKGIVYFNLNFRTLGNNEIKEFTIAAPTAPPETIGLSFEIDSTGQLQIDVFRDATLNATPGGTIRDLTNANEASGFVANTELREDPTIDAEGTNIGSALLAAGKQGQPTAQGDKTNILNLGAEQKVTLVRFTSGATSNVINYIFRIIEDL